jgi:hypothetical protein
MLCNILGFHGGDYEECRRLVPTSEDPHSATSKKTALFRVLEVTVLFVTS